MKQEIEITLYAEVDAQWSKEQLNERVKEIKEYFTRSKCHSLPDIEILGSRIKEEAEIYGNE